MDTSKTYTEIINPEKIIKQFDTIDGFIDWLRIGTTEDLKYCLKAFEDAELYEYCAIIRDEING